jgi:hypothetical protein
MIMNMIKMSILLRLRDSRKSFGQGYVILIITLNFFFLKVKRMEGKVPTTTKFIENKR